MAKELLCTDNTDVATFRGIRIEDPFLDNAKWKMLALSTETIAKLRHAEVYGVLPSDGPAIVFSNHVNLVDIFILPWVATRTAGRSLRIVSRDTLIHPEIEEETHVLARLGKLHKKPHVCEDQQMHPYSNDTDFNQTKKPPFIKRQLGNLLDSAGHPILLHRGKLTDEFIQGVRETLEEGQMVGMFAQETRTPQDDISNIMPGPAILLKRYFPDTPAYIVTVANQVKLHRRPKIRISEPFTYNELSPDGKLSIKQLHGIIKERMYTQLVQDVPNLKA